MAGVRDVIVSRTGYTGEDGFELYYDAAHGPAIWNALVADARVTPAGLGARDSLRLEMKMKKGEFVGRDALERQRAAGLPRKLVGFTTAERTFPRHGYPVFYDGAPSGIVCSGTVSPSLNTPIGTCYLPAAAAKEGTTFEIEIRGKRVPATVVKLPFYKNGSVMK